MAIGTGFTIYQPQFWSGYVEALIQETDIFNGASAGTIILESRAIAGEYEKSAFFKAVAALVARRDPTSTADVADTALANDELITVKLNRRIGPLAQTLNSFIKIGMDPKEMSYVLGQQIGKAVAIDYVNTGLIALDAAIAGVAGLCTDYSGTGTINHGTLVTAFAKMGDAASQIVALVMHSKAYFDLMGQSITDKIVDVAGVTINRGTVATLGKPVIVTDSPALLKTGTPNKYVTLGLTAAALGVIESEGRIIESQIITGKENLIMRIQGEHAYNVGVKGFKWDITNGAANPDDTALGTSTNWDQAFTNIKQLAGVRLLTQ